MFIEFKIIGQQCCQGYMGFCAFLSAWYPWTLYSAWTRVLLDRMVDMRRWSFQVEVVLADTHKQPKSTSDNSDARSTGDVEGRQSTSNCPPRRLQLRHSAVGVTHWEKAVQKW